MILYGPNIKDQTECISKRQPALTIAQLVKYNTYVRRREGGVKRERRNKSRELPLPSLFQHPTVDIPGTLRTRITITNSGDNSAIK